MQLNLGNKIRELRRRDGRTQETLADALGVTSQAVSRWESGGSYPDMEIMPSIANYFGVSIDELFGYHGEREKKVDELIKTVDHMMEMNMRDDVNLDECISRLRDGLAEFPGNEKIMYKLANTLTHTGWFRHREWIHYGEDGHIIYSFDNHIQNEYWTEAAKLFETLTITATSDDIRTKSICELAIIYRLFGETEKAVELADHLPEIRYSRQCMLANSTCGKTQARYLGEALLSLAGEFSDQLVYALVNDRTNYDTDMPVTKLKGVIDLFSLICEDGNLGVYHKNVTNLYLYMSRLQWEFGDTDGAFASLDSALQHARSFDKFQKCDSPHYTAMLVKHAECKHGKNCDGESLANKLSEDWPVWCNPDYSEVEREIKADPRWNEWVKKTKE